MKKDNDGVATVTTGDGRTFGFGCRLDVDTFRSIVDHCERIYGDVDVASVRFSQSRRDRTRDVEVKRDEG